MNIDGRDLESVQLAFEDAFINSTDLEKFLRFRLNGQLSLIAPDANLRDIIYSTIKYYISENRFDDLLINAAAYKHSNAKLKDCLRKYEAKYIGENATSKLRHFTQVSEELVKAQVQRYAKSKYIGGLYVKRKMQGEIESFHQNEHTLASALKRKVMSRIDQVLDILVLGSNDTGHLSNIKQDSEKNFPVIFQKYQDEFQKFPYLLEHTNSFVCKLKESLIPVKESIQSLPEDRLEHESDLRHKLLSDIDNACKIIVPDRVSDREKKEDNEAVKAKRLSLSSEIIIMLDDIIAYDGVSNRNTTHFYTTARQKVLNIHKLLGEDIYSIHTILSAIQDDIVSSSKNMMLIIDRAGGGKTNLLCNLSLNIVQNSPVLLYFGKESLTGSNGLIEKTKTILSELLKCEGSAIDKLDGILAETGEYLNIFIDGINESRKILDYNEAIIKFLEWSGRHRIRITITCRDVYWGFFETERIRNFSFNTIVNELYQFNNKEFEKAIELYLKHYNITGEFVDSARASCSHPLLLRFFCEAYGNLGATSRIDYGLISDFRLKELFDVYFERKMEQIRSAVGHHNPDVISAYLLSVAEYMYSNSVTTILTNDVREATGDGDTSSEGSVYLRMLDEDIIIDEEPTDNPYCRKINFVYEEFMEYVIARYFFLRWKSGKLSNVYEFFKMQNNKITDWINSRGVSEYFTLMLLSKKGSADFIEGIALLKIMIGNGGIWTEIFWSIIGKLDEKALVPELFDTFYVALKTVDMHKNNCIKKSLNSISKYSKVGSEKLASVLLWTSLLPNVIGWADIEKLKSYNEANAHVLATKFTSKLNQNETYDFLNIRFSDLLDWVLPYLPQEKKDKISNKIKAYGKPVDFQSIMGTIRILFREHQPYLLNGILHSDVVVRKNCINGLRHLKEHQGNLLVILREILTQCSLPREEIDLIRNTINWLEGNEAYDDI
jgi:hypothetical protein